MRLPKIVDALNKRSDLTGWTVRHVQTRGAQVYAVPQGIEAQREVNGERYLIDVSRNNTSADGSPAMGGGDVSVLPGDDVEQAIDQATLVAGLVANPVHGQPGPAPLPDVPLSDSDLLKNASAVTLDMMERMRAAAAKRSNVRLTAAECFGEIQHTHLVNSLGIDAEQESTQVDLEFVLIGRSGEREAETFTAIRRRRASDVDVEAVIQERMQHTIDTLRTRESVTWQGPVVLRNEALTTFLAGDNLNGSVIQTLASAASKYAGISPWEIGKPVFRSAVTGDPLTVWANRCMPYGSGSNRFDAEGLGAQKVQLIQDNILTTFAASQRYADYLEIPATGAFGNIELPSGQTSAADLLSEPYVEIVQFSWFNPDPITGDFATEIRFGYTVENGARKPFKGGQLVGNYMDALANVKWSEETGFFGGYLGPHTARFNELRIA